MIHLMNERIGQQMSSVTSNQDGIGLQTVPKKYYSPHQPSNDHGCGCQLDAG